MKNAFLLVLPFKEISPTRFRIKVGYPELYKKTEIRVYNIVIFFG